jgi:lipopolysaccharide/colanic/teichoic acid biosynthesis glycosyltransferase
MSDECAAQRAVRTVTRLKTRQRGWKLSVKKMLDRAIAGLILTVLAPLFAIVSLAVWIGLGSPVFFRQKRPGFNGRPFQIVKFRTMMNRTDASGQTLADEQRLTSLGRFLRATSLDELPEFWNVLRGELSLVGPRPLLMQYLTRYTPEQARRHDVLPGITGWAQINGRNDLPWEEKFSLDVWYVDNWSLHLDFIILAKTVWHVIRQHGISKKGYATTTEYIGPRPN